MIAIVKTLRPSLERIGVSSITGGAIGALAVKIASAGLGYLMFLAMARVMPADQFGKFGFAYNLVIFLSVCSLGGMQVAIMRWIPEFSERGKPELGQAHTHFGTRFIAYTSIAIAMACALAAWIFEPAPLYLIAAAVLIVPMAFAEYMCSVLRARGSVFLALVPRDLIWRLLIVCGCFLAFWSDYTASADEAFLGMAVTLSFLVIFQIAGSRASKSLNKERVRPHRLSFEARRNAIMTAFPLGLSELLLMATLYLDIVILGVFQSPEATGGYFTAARTASLLALVLTSANMISAPLIARHFHNGDMRSLRTVLRQLSMLIAVPTFAMLISYVFMGKFLLQLFDSSYTDQYTVLLTLALGYAFTAIAGPAALLLQLTGHGRQYMNMMVFCCAISFLGLFILVPYIGIWGAAITRTAFLVALSAWALVYARRKIGADPSILSLFPRR